MHDKISVHGSSEAVLGMAAIAIKPIERTSPSLAEMMRVCLLQAGISRAGNSNDYVLSHPAVWLGNAYHMVLERAPRAGISNTDLSLRVQEIWTSSVRAQCDKNEHHVFNRRYGDPEKWPKYTLVQAVAQVRAEELSAALGRVEGATAGPRSENASSVREAWLETPDGKLGGKPDVISNDEICDYKSGNIYEASSSSDDGHLKGAYARQIKIYGHLVRVNLGYLPARGVVMPLSGQREIVELSEAECNVEAQAAIDVLNEYNGALAAGAGPLDLANPSAGACDWCNFKLVCPAFWDICTPDWASDIWGAAISGEISATPEIIHNGEAVSIEVAVDQGTIEAGQVRISPLPISTFEVARDLQPRIRVWIVNLSVRRDGSVKPNDRTIIICENDLPTITMVP